MAAPMAPITDVVKFQSLRTGRMEIWEARSGPWLFVREESPGTPWIVFHDDFTWEPEHQRRPVTLMGSLPKCRRAVADGSLDRYLAYRWQEVAESEQ